MTKTKENDIKAQGEIIKVTGSVVDVAFDERSMPRIFDALETENNGKRLVLEVEQLLAGNVVRCLSMSDTDGLMRGQKVINTGKPISVPVGTATLGRIMNVTGDPQDNRGPIETDLRESIHRNPPTDILSVISQFY